MIAVESALDFNKLNRCRMELLKAAQAFLVTEHEQTRGETACGTTGRRARILADLNDLRLRHSGRIAAWNPREVTKDLPRQRSAAIGMLTALPNAGPGNARAPGQGRRIVAASAVVSIPS